MPQTEPDSPEGPQQTPERTRRRVVFPWVWVGLILAARLALGATDVTVDFKNLATGAAIGLGTIGLSAWYLLRGWGPIPIRLLVAALPFVLVTGCNALFEPQFNGAGAIVGLHRRGIPKADQQLGAAKQEAEEAGLSDWGPGPYDFPRFLGDGPWAESVGPPIDPDWDATPPQELWRRPVGAGWSAFAVYGPYAVTQEQRGDQELVVCYRAETGELVWSHSDPTRFDPEDFAGQMGRQGPRATPTIAGDRVYTQGATGLVNCLDAATGKPVWSVDTAERYGADVPVWGKSGSPLYAPAEEGLESALVVVNVGAPKDPASDYDASLVAFDAATGEEVWTSGSRQTSYASPQLATFHDRRVVMQTSDDLLTAHALDTGEVLFDYPWTGQSDNMPSCSQPVLLQGDRFLLCKGYGHGSALFQVAADGDQWSAEPLWDPAIKPVLQTKYSNTVVREGYAYALNGEQLQCVEIETGEIAWRKRRRPKFGFGQVLMVGDHVMVMTEESGEIVLVRATPDRYDEVAAHRVLAEREVCWNNPVVVGDLLLVRNAVEAAAYRLPLLGSGVSEPEE